MDQEDCVAEVINCVVIINNYKKQGGLKLNFLKEFMERIKSKLNFFTVASYLIFNKFIDIILPISAHLVLCLVRIMSKLNRLKLLMILI